MKVSSINFPICNRAYRRHECGLVRVRQLRGAASAFRAAQLDRFRSEPALLSLERLHRVR
jgi:hypothetical protein